MDHDLLSDIEELLRVREARSREAEGGRWGLRRARQGRVRAPQGHRGLQEGRRVHEGRRRRRRGRPRPREARARVHAEAGAARSQGQEAAPRVQHLRRRGRRRAGQRPQGARQGQEGVGRGLQARARLLRRPPRRPARHRRQRDRAERVQGLPEPRGRLLGRLPGLLVDLPPTPTRSSATWRAPRGRCRAGGRARTTRAEGFFGTLKQEFPYSREWTGVTRDEFCAQLDDYMRWYVRGRPKGFRQGGRTRYEAPAARRRRLGVAVPPERCGIVA